MGDAPEADRWLVAAKAGDERAFRNLIEPHVRELRGYCYRMAGSLYDADDLLQESLLRAWKGLDRFEQRANLRTWLYRVTTNACIDALERRPPRTLPTAGGEPLDSSEPPPPPKNEPIWLEPCPESMWTNALLLPDARYAARESVAIAFLAALQLLSPRQRAALIARDVLGMSADECAALLETSVVAANSALQRARDTLKEQTPKWQRRTAAVPAEASTRLLLARYVDAWERADAAALVSLLHEDATLSMPPFPFWLRGARAIARSVGAMVLTPGTGGAFRFVPTEANGLPALAAYRKSESGSFEPSGIHVFEIEGERIAAITAFLDATLFARFGLPETAPEA